MRSRSGATWRPTPWPGTWRRSTRPGGETPQPSPSLWRGRPLTRQMREAQKIANEAPGRLINGRYGQIPPAIRPLTPGHLLDREALRGEQIRGVGQWQPQRSCQNFKNFLSTDHLVPILYHFCIPFLVFLTSGHTMACLTRMLLPLKSFVSVVI